MAPRFERIGVGLRWLFVAWSSYLALLLFAYAFHVWGIERNRLDSAWLVEAGLVLAMAAIRRDAGESPEPLTEPAVLPLFLGFQAAGFLLYAGVLQIGLLADDFPLASRAVRGDLLRPDDLFFRPLPLFVWAVVSKTVSMAALPMALHVVNVAIHSANAALVAWLARRLGVSAVLAWAAGAAFLVFPAHVEAVAWSSGIQDTLATLCVLAFLLLVSGPRSTSRVLFAFVALICALSTKETSIVAFAIGGILVLAMRRGLAGRATWWTIASGAIISAAFVVWRLAHVGPRVDNAPSLTHRGIEHFLTSPFGALGSPWTAVDLAAYPWLGFVSTVVVLGLVLAAFGGRRWIGGIQIPAALCVSALLAVLPVGRYFFVAPDLQGSRYLYLPCVFFVLLIVYLVQVVVRRGHRAAAYGVFAMLITCWVYGTVIHQRSWRLAGTARDALLAATVDAARQDGCQRLWIERLPDNVDGAYVFRSGFAEALDAAGVTRPVTVSGSRPADACAIPWSPGR